MTWNLDGLYQEDANSELVKDLIEARNQAVQFADAYRGKLQDKSLTPSALYSAIEKYEAICELIVKPYLYGYLYSSQDKRDPRREAVFQMVMKKRDEIGHTLLFFPLELSAISEESLLRLAATDELQNYANFFHSLVRCKPYMMDEAREEFVRTRLHTERKRLEMSYDRLVGSLLIHVPMGGELQPLNAAQALACLRAPEHELRSNVHLALFGELGSHGTEFGDLLASLLRNHHWENRQRGLKSPEQKFYLMNQMDPSTMDTVAAAVESRYEEARKYLRTKARLLGMKRLKASDLQAPLSSGVHMEFSASSEILLGSLGSYHPLFRSLLERLLGGQWIDATVRSGKVPVPFCKCYSPAQHPYISLSYGGGVRDLLTLAHELGHALHYRLASGQSFLNFQPAPLLAEFSGTFFEILLVHHLLHEPRSPVPEEELIIAHMDSIMTTVFRQHAITRFERVLYDQASSAALDVETICDQWWKENVLLYGDTVEMNSGYRWGWSSIWHIFHKPFYCCSYVFGNLLSMVMYEIYREGGPHVLNDLIAIWSAGGSQRPAAMLKRMGLDPSESYVWDHAFRYLDRLSTRAGRIPGKQF